MAGVIKVSLHETGDYRLAFNVEKLHLKPAVAVSMAHPVNTEERVERRWSCQLNVAKDITLAAKIRFPTLSLKPFTGERYDNKEIMWVPAAPPGAVTQIFCLISDQQLFSGQNSTIIWSSPLPNGKYVIFAYGYDGWYEEEERHTRNVRKDFEMKLEDAQFRKSMLRDELGFGEFRLKRENVTLGFDHIDPIYKCLILWEVSLTSV